VREIGRATQGVRLIRLDEGDKVVAAAKIAPEDDEEEAGPNAEPGGGQVQGKVTDSEPGDGS